MSASIVEHFYVFEDVGARQRRAVARLAEVAPADGTDEGLHQA